MTKYVYVATEAFWRSFHRLPSQQKTSVRQKWQIFKLDPFDPRLRPHEIRKLSARFGKTVHAVVVEGDLRVVFVIDGNCVTSLDVGDHNLYR